MWGWRGGSPAQEQGKAVRGWTLPKRREDGLGSLRKLPNRILSEEAEGLRNKGGE